MKPKVIERDGKKLKDWQVVRVEVDAKGDIAPDRQQGAVQEPRRQSRKLPQSPDVRAGF